MLAGLDEIPFPIPNILVATSFGVRVAGVVLELGGCYIWSIVVLGNSFYRDRTVHHGVLGGVDTVGNDNTCIRVNCCPNLIDASIEVGSAGESSRGERIRRASCAIRHTGGEERPVRLHCREESAGQIRDGAVGGVAIERTEGSVELLEGLNTEPRHDDGFRGYRGR